MCYFRLIIYFFWNHLRFFFDWDCWNPQPYKIQIVLFIFGAFLLILIYFFYLDFMFNCSRQSCRTGSESFNCKSLKMSLHLSIFKSHSKYFSISIFVSIKICIMRRMNLNLQQNLGSKHCWNNLKMTKILLCFLNIDPFTIEFIWLLQDSDHSRKTKHCWDVD